MAFGKKLDERLVGLDNTAFGLSIRISETPIVAGHARIVVSGAFEIGRNL